MPKPNKTFTVKQMKDYIRQHKINHPAVKLSMKRADMIEGLKKTGHWDTSKDTPTPKKPAPKKKPMETKKNLSLYYINLPDKINDIRMVKDPDDLDEEIGLEDFIEDHVEFPALVGKGKRKWKRYYDDKIKRQVIYNEMYPKEASELRKKYKLPSGKTKPYSLYKIPYGK